MADGAATTSPEGVQGIVLASSSQTTGTGYNLGLITSSDLAGSIHSIVVLSPTASGALTISGNAKVSVPGAIVVDSSSSSAISGSGTASLTASIIDVVGGYQKASGETLQSRADYRRRVAGRPACRAGRAEHQRPDQLWLRQPDQRLDDHQPWHLQLDQGVEQRQPDDECRHLHHRGRRLQRVSAAPTSPARE